MTANSKTEPPHSDDIFSHPIAAGSCSRVYAIDENRVIKRRPETSDEYRNQVYNIEIFAYKRLGTNPRIATLIEVNNEGLILERGECLRQKLQSSASDEIKLDSKLQWAQEAAEGLVYIHRRDIIHADVGCHNVLLMPSGHIKYIDFAGSGIDGNPALVCYEWCSYQPELALAPCVKTDIFAFGTMLFEIESGNVPYRDLVMVSAIDGMQRVGYLFSIGQYPNVASLVLGDVILRCWDGEYDSMQEVLDDITCCIKSV